MHKETKKIALAISNRRVDGISFDEVKNYQIKLSRIGDFFSSFLWMILYHETDNQNGAAPLKLKKKAAAINSALSRKLNDEETKLVRDIWIKTEAGLTLSEGISGLNDYW